MQPMRTQREYQRHLRPEEQGREEDEIGPPEDCDPGQRRDRQVAGGELEQQREAVVCR
jgi:hypothetical protein